jgi:hypothetical protein
MNKYLAISSDNTSVEKRPKRTEPSGLLAGWKQKLAKDKSTTIARKYPNLHFTLSN